MTVCFRQPFTYTKLVFFNTVLLTAPNPILNITLPTVHINTFRIVAFIGAAMEAMLNRNIPIIRDSSIDIHSFCLQITLMHR